MQYIGSVTVRLYAKELYKRSALNHLVFLSLEKSLIGNWLRIIRGIGEYFYDQKQTHVFHLWTEFVSNYYYENRTGKIDTLIEFRNNVRHGSAGLNEENFQKIRSTFFAFLEELAFISEYSLSCFKDQVILSKNDTSDKISLAPLLEKGAKEGEYVFKIAGDKGIQKDVFFSTLGFAIEYADYIKGVQGIYKVPEKNKDYRCLEMNFDELLQYEKILITGIPYSGKTSFALHLDLYVKSSKTIIPYVIDGSPVYISPLVALKSIYNSLLCKLGMEVDCNFKGKTSIDILRALENTLLANKNEQFIIVIDGVFDWKSQYIIDNYEQWNYLFHYDFPKNFTLIVTALKNFPVVAFYDFIFDISNLMPFNYEPTEALFEKIMRAFSIDEEWEKTVIYALSTSEEALASKEIAKMLNLFTPKVEKFLYTIRPLLKKQGNGYEIYHPLLKCYIKNHIKI